MVDVAGGVIAAGVAAVLPVLALPALALEAAVGFAAAGCPAEVDAAAEAAAAPGVVAGAALCVALGAPWPAVLTAEVPCGAASGLLPHAASTSADETKMLGVRARRARVEAICVKSMNSLRAEYETASVEPRHTKKQAFAREVIKLLHMAQVRRRGVPVP